MIRGVHAAGGECIADVAEEAFEAREDRRGVRSRVRAEDFVGRSHVLRHERGVRGRTEVGDREVNRPVLVLEIEQGLGGEEHCLTQAGRAVVLRRGAGEGAGEDGDEAAGRVRTWDTVRIGYAAVAAHAGAQVLQRELGEDQRVVLADQPRHERVVLVSIRRGPRARLGRGQRTGEGQGGRRRTGGEERASFGRRGAFGQGDGGGG